MLIELDHVSFSYGDAPALRDVSASISAGESVALMGPNGCGKSTLLRVLNGLSLPQSGVYRFDGDEINAKTLKSRTFAKRFHQRMGFVFQNPDVQLFCPSVETEISFGPRQMGLSRDEVAQRTADCIALMDLEPLRARPPYALSGGEKRRVTLACVLSMNPEVLALDEPFNGLDEDTCALLTGVLNALHQSGKTILLSTHDRTAAETLCSRVLRFDKTHVLTEDTRWN